MLLYTDGTADWRGRQGDHLYLRGDRVQQHRRQGGGKLLQECVARRYVFVGPVKLEALSPCTQTGRCCAARWWRADGWLAEAYVFPFGSHPGKKNHVITTQTEHKCVLDSCRILQQQGFEVTYLPVQQNGLICMKQLEVRPPMVSLACALDDETKSPARDIHFAWPLTWSCGAAAWGGGDLRRRCVLRQCWCR